MKPVFQIDGVAYDVLVPAGGIKRSFAVLDGSRAGRLQTGRMERDIIGTYYNYTVTLETAHLDSAQYDRLYEVLSSPRDWHLVEMPYGQTMLRFEAYISGGDDQLQLLQENRGLWGGLTVTFTAMEPARRPE